MDSIEQSNDCIELVKFAKKYPKQWHTYAKDKRTVKAVKEAFVFEWITINEFNQFKYIGV